MRHEAHTGMTMPQKSSDGHPRLRRETVAMERGEF
jgi:hypothetical protein